MKNRYHDLNTYLKNIYGCRVQKISLDAGLTCPNRDGTLSVSGCIYCNRRGSGTGAFQKGLSITHQLLAGKQFLSHRYHAKKFIAYFQSFSNTYGPIEQLKLLYEEALAVDDVVGLSIGTRPDCVNEDILNLLESYTKTHLIWIEYGLQSGHDKTLAVINRGHDVAAFQKAVAMTQNRGIHICAHVILGLPGETKSDMIQTAKLLASTGIDGLKIHLLYIVKGTKLEEMYLAGQYRPMEADEYVDAVCEFLAHTPPNVVIQRLTGDPHPEELAAPTWALDKTKTLNCIKQTLAQRNWRQGIFTDNLQ